ncbi:hypothetical protein HGM15179_020166 [Zosterops borbonicus]|uniref:ribonuclease H n=1 Tax=Zosterops borbonicus TaxID=364589 RepID=A0A8K1D893_9PASS|nr:hypothetical protein HGM15179_020166 [Zosterops borbonicus]
MYRLMSLIGGLLLGRSSTSKQGVIVIPGIIDADFTRQVKILAYALQTPVTIPKGSRIAQIVALENILPHRQCPKEPHEKHRMNRGFGSTGHDVFFTLDLTNRPFRTVRLQCGSHKFKLKLLLDTGSDVSILNQLFWPSDWPLQAPTSHIVGVGGRRISAISADPIHISFKNVRVVAARLSAFFLMASAEQPPILKITWLTDNPVWVEQWPMTETRLQIAEQLIQEQLDAGHIRPSVRPWNTPIFVIPKKSGKWRLLHDLRKVNEQMQAMGALQPGLPAPTMIPQGWSIVVIDLKVCFFTIPLHPQDTQHFAFTVPSINRAAPTKRYEWVVLPQGMRNSPCMCQLFVDWALRPIRQHFSDALIYHYMDDILIATKQPLSNAKMDRLILQLEHQGLTVVPEKLQRSAPWKYLGWLITDAQIRPQKITLHDTITTLHDTQKLFGDLQWVRPIVGITNDELLPFLSWLCGNDANSSRPKCGVMSRTDAFAALIKKGRDRIVEIDGKEPADISIPMKDEDLEWLLRHSVALQKALLGFADAGPVWVPSRFTRACPPARIPSDSENDPDDNDLPGTTSDDPEPD